MKSKIGFALFAIGVAVAVTGGAKAPAEGADWPDTLLVFGVGVVFAIVGLGLWWSAERDSQANSDDPVSMQKNIDPVLELRQLHEDLRVLNAEAHTLSLQIIRESVERINSERIYGLVEARHALNSQLGMSEGAEVMIAFAYCERMLNRAWSAAADGHQKEALSSMQEACDASEGIVNLLSKGTAV